jgi:hypothetical protein
MDLAWIDHRLTIGSRRWKWTPQKQSVVAPTNPVVSSSSASQSAPSRNGAQFGTYSLKLPSGYYAVLGATAPTQSQLISATEGDIVWRSDLGGSPLVPGRGERIVTLPNGATPSYQACADGILLTGSASYVTGTAFCVIETTGKMAGVTVTSSSLTQPSYIVLQVTVWQNTLISTANRRPVRQRQFDGLGVQAACTSTSARGRRLASSSPSGDWQPSWLSAALGTTALGRTRPWA